MRELETLYLVFNRKARKVITLPIFSGVHKGVERLISFFFVPSLRIFSSRSLWLSIFIKSVFQPPSSQILISRFLLQYSFYRFSYTAIWFLNVQKCSDGSGDIGHFYIRKIFFCLYFPSIKNEWNV